jgi:hypothetical protein
MKPTANVPEMWCYLEPEWESLRQILGLPVFQLEGLDGGRIDKGFLYQGVLFRLISVI